jgi:hypothetical protein
MKLFIDANLITFWARYEGYVMVGEQDEALEDEHVGWQGEVHALKRLLDWHEIAGFRFAVTPTILSEMASSPSLDEERSLLQSLVENTLDCIDEEKISFTDEAVEAVLPGLGPGFARQNNDCRAVAEAIVLECDIFLTNDTRLARKADPLGRISIMRPTEVVSMWARQFGEME